MAAPSATDDDSLVPFDSERRSSMSNLLEEGKYSDVTITCGNDSYAVHKAIICPRSHFFAACCDGQFKESFGVINLPDDDPLAVRMMIRFLYTGTYKPPWRPQSGIINNGEYGPLETYATPPAASTSVTTLSAPQSQSSVNSSAILSSATTLSGARTRTSVNAAVHSTTASAPSRAQTQRSGFSNERGRHNSRNERGRRYHGNRRENHTSNSRRPSAPATPVSARAPASVSVPAASAPAPARPPPGQQPNLTLHAKIYALGEKYGMQDLKALALQRFAYEATFFHAGNSFYNGAKEAYASTVDSDRKMRDVVVDTMLKNRYLLDRSSYHDLLKKTDLGFDLLMRLKHK